MVCVSVCIWCAFKRRNEFNKYETSYHNFLLLRRVCIELLNGQHEKRCRIDSKGPSHLQSSLSFSVICYHTQLLFLIHRVVIILILFVIAINAVTAMDPIGH